SGLGDEVDEALDRADELGFEVGVRPHLVAEPRPEAVERHTERRAQALLPRTPLRDLRPGGEPERFRTDARPDVDEGMAGDEDGRMIDRRSDARLLGADDEMIEEDPEPTLAAGLEQIGRAHV